MRQLTNRNHIMLDSLRTFKRHDLPYHIAYTNGTSTSRLFSPKARLVNIVRARQTEGPFRLRLKERVDLYDSSKGATTNPRENTRIATNREWTIQSE